MIQSYKKSNVLHLKSFPRFFMGRALELAPFISGITVDEEMPFGVVDVAKDSISIRWPQHQPAALEVGQEINFNVTVEGKRYFQSGRVYRRSSTVLQFDISKEDKNWKSRIKSFLDAKKCGSYIFPVDTQFFSPEQEFKNWYHGPNHSNIFIWKDHGVIRRFLIEFDGRYLNWDFGVVIEGESIETLRWQTEDYAYSVCHPVSRGESDPQWGKQMKIFFEECVIGYPELLICYDLLQDHIGNPQVVADI